MGAELSCHTGVCASLNDAEDFVESRWGIVPPLLYVSVPRGPTWVAGLYRLVSDQTANGCPLWKATHTNAWLYSMTTGKWGIGGKGEAEAGFRAGAAYVFCDELHNKSLPNQASRCWQHNRPAWTNDRDIFVESWPETVTVHLQKCDAMDKFGLQTSIVEPVESSQDLPVLRVHAIGDRSLLSRWNSEAAALGRRKDVVAVGSDVLRVDSFTDPAKMQEALKEGEVVEVEFKRPEVLPGRRPRRSQGRTLTRAHVGPPTPKKEEASPSSTASTCSSEGRTASNRSV